jgi:hypothetical protein
VNISLTAGTNTFVLDDIYSDDIMFFIFVCSVLQNFFMYEAREVSCWCVHICPSLLFVSKVTIYHRYLRDVVCSRHISLQKIHFNKSEHKQQSQTPNPKQGRRAGLIDMPF